MSTQAKFKLDIACGSNKQKGFWGVDIVKEGTQADQQIDLEVFPWPFEDNSVDEAFCSHYIEHTKDLIKFMNEVHRILKPGAKVNFIAPYYSSVRAWQDPTHTRAISEPTFLYYDQDWLKANKLDHYPITADFKVVKINYAISEEYTGKSQEAIQYAASHFINVINDINIVLQKKKGVYDHTRHK